MIISLLKSVNENLNNNLENISQNEELKLHV